MMIGKLKGIIAIILFLIPSAQYCQALINYSNDNRSAYLHNNEFLNGGKDLNIKTIESYPIKGAYSPSHYGLLGVKSGSGACNYIFFPTKNVLIPGQQYHINLTIKVTKDYKQLLYFMDHFGFALSSDLFENHFGLWGKQYIPFGRSETDIPVTMDFEFRPLCTSKYLLIGVFQGPTMDVKDCFGCKYHFELHSLTVEKSKNPDSRFYYLCDAYEEKKLDKWNYSNPDTIYFESGSALVKGKYYPLLDSIPGKLRTVQDLIYLFGFTDNKGSENEALGAARNTSVRAELIRRGIDSTRLVMVNYGEKYASKNIAAKDRKVEIRAIGLQAKYLLLY